MTDKRSYQELKRLEAKGLNFTQIRVYQEIEALVALSEKRGTKNKKGDAYCFAAQKKIAKRIGKSLRTVARAIAELKKEGLIEVQRTTRNAHTTLIKSEAKEQ